MDKLVAQFPKQIADAIEIATKSTFNFNKNKTFNNVVICGMGGSGIGGKMVSQLFADQAKLPIVLKQHCSMNAFLNENTLVIASSYSGRTAGSLASLLSAQRNEIATRRDSVGIQLNILTH